MRALEREATRPWRDVGEAAESSVRARPSASPWRAVDATGLSYRLMQYNPPYTLPWLRTNAVAVKVYKEGIGAGVQDASYVEEVEGGGSKDFWASSQA